MKRQKLKDSRLYGEKGVVYPDKYPQQNNPQRQAVTYELLLRREEGFILHLFYFICDLRFFCHRYPLSCIVFHFLLINLLLRVALPHGRITMR